MEEKILQELIFIKWLLVAIFITAAIPSLLIMLTRIFGFRLKFQSRTDSFVRICMQMFEDAEYGELREYCQSELEKRPNNASASYWLARAFLSEKNYVEAKEQFLKTVEIEPSWLKETIQPHLDAMQNGR